MEGLGTMPHCLLSGDSVTHTDAILVVSSAAPTLFISIGVY